MGKGKSETAQTKKLNAGSCISVYVMRSDVRVTHSHMSLATNNVMCGSDEIHLRIEIHNQRFVVAITLYILGHRCLELSRERL